MALHYLEVCETDIKRVLVASVRFGEIFTMDQLSTHKSRKLRALVEAVGAVLLYLPAALKFPL